MNAIESHIENMRQMQVSVPASLAVEALVERYFEGWDGVDIAALPATFDFCATPDWEDLAHSPAWAGVDEGDLIAGLFLRVFTIN